MNNNDSFSKKGVTYHKETKEIQSCLFCRIHQREESGVIIFEDEEFVVFQPRSPVTRFHYLVTPRNHIKDLSSITFSKQILQGVTFLYRLKQAAMKAILTHSNNNEHITLTAKYCFHNPPFNSIDHLHLHVIGEPDQMSWRDWFRFPNSFETFYCIDIDSIIQSLCPSFYEHLRVKGILYHPTYSLQEED